MPIISEANLAEIAAMNGPAVDSAHGGTVSAKGLTQAQLESARADWVKYGHDPARFDASLAAEGVTIAPRDHALEASRTELALPANPQPADYTSKIDWPRDFMAEKTPEQRSTLQNASGEFGVAVGADPSVTAYLIERVSLEAPKLARMSKDERQMVLDRRRNDAVKALGSDEAYDAQLKQAKAVVEKLAGQTEIGKALAASDVLTDPWVLRTLLGHAKAVEEFAKRHPAK